MSDGQIRVLGWSVRHMLIGCPSAGLGAPRARSRIRQIAVQVWPAEAASESEPEDEETCRKKGNERRFNLASFSSVVLLCEVPASVLVIPTVAAPLSAGARAGAGGLAWRRREKLAPPGRPIGRRAGRGGRAEGRTLQAEVGSSYRRPTGLRQLRLKDRWKLDGNKWAEYCKPERRGGVCRVQGL